MLLLRNNRSVFAGYKLPKHSLLNANAMHNNLEDLDELILIDEILIEAKFLDGPEDLQFLVDF